MVRKGRWVVVYRMKMMVEEEKTMLVGGLKMEGDILWERQ